MSPFREGVVKTLRREELLGRGMAVAPPFCNARGGLVRLLVLAFGILLPVFCGWYCTCLVCFFSQGVDGWLTRFGVARRAIACDWRCAAD